MIDDKQVKDLVTELTNREFSKYWKKHHPNTPMFVDGQMSDKALEVLGWECECASDVVNNFLNGRVKDVLTEKGIEVLLAGYENQILTDQDNEDFKQDLLNGQVRKTITLYGIRFALGLVEGKKYLIDIEKENK